MKNAITYLTRHCPRNCKYCSIRDSKGVGTELDSTQWIKAFSILKEIGVTFNLILGNEPWLLGDKLIPVFKSNSVPYAMYTTCPTHLFERYRQTLLVEGVIDNLSCGVDYPNAFSSEQPDDTMLKSQDAWDAFVWTKANCPNVDVQGTITIHRQNLPYLHTIVSQLTSLNIFAGINMVHWNRDGKYDFFPEEEVMKEYLFTSNEFDVLVNVFKSLLEDKGNLLIYNPEYLQAIIKNPEMIQMRWHCQGDPYGGPTIDSDGRLRVCGYRKGRYTPKLTIFDLPKRLDDWKEAVYKDTMECPGCSWVCPWIYHFWQETDPQMGEKVFTSHAGEYIPKEKWSKRKTK